MPEMPKLVVVREEEEGVVFPQSVVTGNACTATVLLDDADPYRWLRFEFNKGQHYDADACRTFATMFKECAVVIEERTARRLGRA